MAKIIKPIIFIWSIIFILSLSKAQDIIVRPGLLDRILETFQKMKQIMSDLNELEGVLIASGATTAGPTTEIASIEQGPSNILARPEILDKLLETFEKIKQIIESNGISFNKDSAEIDAFKSSKKEIIIDLNEFISILIASGATTIEASTTPKATTTPGITTAGSTKAGESTAGGTSEGSTTTPRATTKPEATTTTSQTTNAGIF